MCLLGLGLARGALLLRRLLACLERLCELLRFCFRLRLGTGYSTQADSRREAAGCGCCSRATARASTARRGDGRGGACGGTGARRAARARATARAGAATRARAGAGTRATAGAGTGAARATRRFFRRRHELDRVIANDVLFDIFDVQVDFRERAVGYLDGSQAFRVCRLAELAFLAFGMHDRGRAHYYAARAEPE